MWRCNNGGDGKEKRLTVSCNFGYCSMKRNDSESESERTSVMHTDTFPTRLGYAKHVRGLWVQRSLGSHAGRPVWDDCQTEHCSAHSKSGCFEEDWTAPLFPFFLFSHHGVLFIRLSILWIMPLCNRVFP
jgi:hypothetical protein